MDKIVEINHLKKSFGEKLVLNDINFSVNEGEVACLIGKSGSGKTTLLRCINLLEIPNNGSIRVKDTTVNFSESKSVSKNEISEIRKHSGMVFQSFNLFPHKTVIQNIIEAPVIVKKMKKKIAIEKGKQLLSKVGLEEHSDKYPSSLSGGQQQRAAIARALMMNPDLLLFDEPTSALDPTLVREVLNVIKQLSKEKQTMVIVTHEMDFAYEVADKIFFINEGDVKESGSPEQIFKSPQSMELKEFLRSIGEK